MQSRAKTWLTLTLARGIIINSPGRLMEMENDSHALQHPLQLSVFLSPIFLTSGANFQKTQPPPNLSLLISPAGTCQQPGQHTACRKRRERINEGCFRRERFSPRINLSWKRSLYKAPFPLLKGHPALLQEAPCFFLNVLLWDTSLFLPQLYGFIQNKKKWWKKKKSMPNLQLPLKPK